MKTRLRQRDEEAEMRLDSLIGPKPESLTARDWCSYHEQMRLCTLYPGEYVVHRDHHTGRGRNERLALREVVSHSRHLKVVQAFFRTLSEEERPHYFLCYVETD